MTDQDWIELGRRAVACRGWRWMPGMLVNSTNNYHRPARIESLDGDAYGLTVIPDADGPVFASHHEHEYGIVGAFPRGCTIPDFRDPATLGCVLALVREAWGGKIGGTDRYKMPDGDSELWGIHVWTADSSVVRRFTAPTEAHALVAALESAP